MLKSFSAAARKTPRVTPLPFIFAEDEVAVIDVKTVSGTVNVFVENHSSTYTALTSAKRYEFAAQYDGYIQFYVSSGGTLTADIMLKSEMLTDVEELKTEQSVIKNELFEDGTISTEHGTFDTSSGSTSSSSTELRTIGYIDEAIIKVDFNSDCRVRVFAYQQDGTYVGGYTGSGFSKSWSSISWMKPPVYVKEISNQNYLYKLNFKYASGSSALTPEALAADVEKSIIREIDADMEEVYTVGAGKDYATFTGMLTALKDNTHKKIVYVYPGEYDIFTEKGGAEYISGLSISGKTWRDVCEVVPPNTHIIGLGTVVLTWNPTDAQIIDDDHAFLFAPLNLSGNCEIENIKIHCSNCRYGIHDETSGLSVYNGVTHILKNVEVVYSSSTYGTKYAYGAGHNKNSKYVFENCLFSAAYATPWSTHDWTAAANENSTFEFRNCVFVNNNTGNPANIRFSSSDTVGRLDDVKIIGCVFGSVSFATEGTSNVRQGYKVETMLCKTYSISYYDQIIEQYRVAPVNYLQIS